MLSLCFFEKGANHVAQATLKLTLPQPLECWASPIPDCGAVRGGRTVPFKGILELQPVFLLPSCQTTTIYLITRIPDICPATGPKRWGQMTKDWNFWKHGPRSTFPPCEFLPQGFCYSHRKSTHTAVVLRIQVIGFCGGEADLVLIELSLRFSMFWNPPKG